MSIDSLVRQGMDDVLKTLVDDFKRSKGKETASAKLDEFIFIINNTDPKYKHTMIEIAEDIKNRCAEV